MTVVMGVRSSWAGHGHEVVANLIDLTEGVAVALGFTTALVAVVEEDHEGAHDEDECDLDREVAYLPGAGVTPEYVGDGDKGDGGEAGDDDGGDTCAEAQDDAGVGDDE
jgi:hypothetical protein